MKVSPGARMTRPTASTGRGTCKDDDDAVKLPRPFYPVLIETHSETAVTADGSGGRASGSHTRIYTRWRAHMHARTRARSAQPAHNQRATSKRAQPAYTAHGAPGQVGRAVEELADLAVLQPELDERLVLDLSVCTRRELSKDWSGSRD